MDITGYVRKRQDEEGQSTASDDKNGDEIPDDGSLQAMHERKRINKRKMEEISTDSDLDRNKGKMEEKSTDSDLDRNKGKMEEKSTDSDLDGNKGKMEEKSSDSYSEDSGSDSDYFGSDNSDVEYGDPKLFQKSYWEKKRFPCNWPRDKPYDREKDLYQDGFFPMGTDFGIPRHLKVANLCLPYYHMYRRNNKSDPVNILTLEAINLYNQANDEAYKFRQVENVNSRCAVGRFYFITFTAYNPKKATDGGEGPFETFQALGYTGFTDKVYIKEYGKSKVLFCRPAKKY